MTYEQVVAQLRQYRQGLAAEAVLEADAEQLRAQADKMAGLPGAAAIRKELRAELAKLSTQQHESMARRRETLKIIEQIRHPLRHEIMYRRYILGQQWEDMADTMHMDERYIRRRHHETIELLRQQTGP